MTGLNQNFTDAMTGVAGGAALLVSGALSANALDVEGQTFEQYARGADTTMLGTVVNAEENQYQVLFIDRAGRNISRVDFDVDELTGVAQTSGKATEFYGSKTYSPFEFEGDRRFKPRDEAQDNRVNWQYKENNSPMTSVEQAMIDHGVWAYTGDNVATNGRIRIEETQTEIEVRNEIYPLNGNKSETCEVLSDKAAVCIEHEYIGPEFNKQAELIYDGSVTMTATLHIAVDGALVSSELTQTSRGWGQFSVDDFSSDGEIVADNIDNLLNQNKSTAQYGLDM